MFVLGSGISCMSGSVALTIDLKGMFGLCTFSSSYSLGERGFVGFNVDLILLEMLFFSIRILVSCTIVLNGSLSSFFCMLCPREGSSSFSYNVMCSRLLSYCLCRLETR